MEEDESRVARFLSSDGCETTFKKVSSAKKHLID